MEEYVDIRAEYAQPALPVVLQSSIHPNLWVELDGCFWLWVAARSGAKQVLFPFGIFVCPRNMIFCFATRQLVGRDIKLRPRKLGTGRGRWIPMVPSHTIGISFIIRTLKFIHQMEKKSIVEGKYKKLLLSNQLKLEVVRQKTM
jgi:hypothetical protein